MEMGEKGRKCERKRDKYRDKERDRVREIERERERKKEKAKTRRREKREKDRCFIGRGRNQNARSRRVNTCPVASVSSRIN